MTDTYRFVAAADQDVADIYRFTYERWGEGQADAYIDELHEKCASAADRPGLGRPRPEYGPDIRSIRFEAHTIYYRAVAEIIEVLAVLHDARDADTVLAGRAEGSE